MQSPRITSTLDVAKRLAGVLGLALGIVNLTWQFSLSREAKAERMDTRLGIDVELGARKVDVFAEVVNIGQRPIHIRDVELHCGNVPPYPTYSLEAKLPEDQALQPGAARKFWSKDIELSDCPLVDDKGVPSERRIWSVNVSTNMGQTQRRSEFSFWSVWRSAPVAATEAKRKRSPGH